MGSKDLVEWRHHILTMAAKEAAPKGIERSYRMGYTKNIWRIDTDKYLQ